jgi:hypothetical protein
LYLAWAGGVPSGNDAGQRPDVPGRERHAGRRGGKGLDWSRLQGVLGRMLADGRITLTSENFKLDVTDIRRRDRAGGAVHGYHLVA